LIPFGTILNAGEKEQLRQTLTLFNILKGADQLFLLTITSFFTEKSPSQFPHLI